MAPALATLPTKAAAIVRHPRTRKIAIWITAIFVAIGVLLGLAAPPLLRGKIASELSTKLHRPVTIEQIKFNPYALTVTVRGFLMQEKQGQTPALSFDELFVNLELRSLIRLAPVIKELRLVKPYINVVRHRDRKYNFQDLIDEFTAAPSVPTRKFALNNIQLIDGKIDFDDQPEQTKHTITALKIGLPFISSFSSHVKIKVKPEFAAVINGAPFHIVGDSTTPFSDSIESELGITLDKLAIAKYLEYSPVALNFKVPSGQLNGKVTASFKTAPKIAPLFALSGDLNVNGLEMQQLNAAPLIKLPNFDRAIGAFEVFNGKLTLKSVKSQGLEVHVAIDRKGELNLANLVTPSASSDPTPIGPQLAAVRLRHGHGPARPRPRRGDGHQTRPAGDGGVHLPGRRGPGGHRYGRNRARRRPLRAHHRGLREQRCLLGHRRAAGAHHPHRPGHHELPCRPGPEGERVPSADGRDDLRHCARILHRPRLRSRCAPHSENQKGDPRRSRCRWRGAVSAWSRSWPPAPPTGGLSLCGRWKKSSPT